MSRKPETGEEDMTERVARLETELAITRTRLAEARWALEAAERRAEQLAEDLDASAQGSPKADAGRE